MSAMLRTLLCAGLICVLLAGCGGSGAARPAGATDAGPPQDTVKAGAIERWTLPSAALNRTMEVAVYLPPAYDKTVAYPVLYMFYGYGGNQNSYFDYLNLNRSADRLIAGRAIKPLIIVVPNYHNSFGVNSTVEQAAHSAGGSIGMYEDYLIKELLPYVDGRYSTLATADGRYVGGISMGGFASLYLGLSHPRLFSKIGAHSAALWDYSSNDQFIGQRDWLYATPALRAQRDPLLLAARVDLRGLRFYMDVGDADALGPEVRAMYRVLQSAGAAAEIHGAPGGHTQTYWSSQLDNYLRFYGN